MYIYKFSAENTAVFMYLYSIHITPIFALFFSG